MSSTATAMWRSALSSITCSSLGTWRTVLCVCVCVSGLLPSMSSLRRRSGCWKPLCGVHVVFLGEAAGRVRGGWAAPAFPAAGTQAQRGDLRPSRDCVSLRVLHYWAAASQEAFPVPLCFLPASKIASAFPLCEAEPEYGPSSREEGISRCHLYSLWERGP